MSDGDKDAKWAKYQQLTRCSKCNIFDCPGGAGCVLVDASIDLTALSERKRALIEEQRAMLAANPGCDIKGTTHARPRRRSRV